jgi:hypothetical protein
MSIDHVGQLLLGPHSAGQHFAAALFDHLGNFTAHTTRIAGVAIRIQDEHALVNILRQTTISLSLSITVVLIHAMVYAIPHPIRQACRRTGDGYVDLFSIVSAEPAEYVVCYIPLGWYCPNPYPQSGKLIRSQSANHVLKTLLASR